MRTSSIITGITIATFGFASLVSAGIPSSPPSGADPLATNQGIFARYFQNLATGCNQANSVITGFTPSGADYLKPSCSTVQSLLGALFSSLGLHGGPIVFNNSGVPGVYDFSGLTQTQISNLVNQISLSPNITNVFNNSSYTGSLNNYLTQYFITNPVVSSQWKNLSGGGIGYTGGFIRVGPSTTTYTTLGFNSTGPQIGTYIDPGFGYIYLGWNSGLGQTHIGNGSSGYGDLFARNIQAYGNLSVSGSTNLGGNVNIAGNLTVNGTGSFNRICLPSGCISNFSSVGGSKWTDIAGGAIQRNSNVIVTGNITANGFLYSSDRNLKKNIETLGESSLEKILKLTGYSYEWKGNGKRDIGLIAQEVETVYPELVHTDNSGMKSVEYGNLIAPLIEAIKTQQKEIDSLKRQIESLKK